MTMTTIVVGDTGLIAFDTHYSNEIAARVLKSFREATGNQMPVHTIIYSHHHPDQHSGTAAYVTPEQVENGEVNVIAHEEFFENVVLESGYASMRLSSHLGRGIGRAPSPGKQMPRLRRCRRGSQ